MGGAALPSLVEAPEAEAPKEEAPPEPKPVEEAQPKELKVDANGTALIEDDDEEVGGFLFEKIWR